MDDGGGVFKRCGCRNPLTGRRLDRSCPRLAESGHGVVVLHVFGAECVRAGRAGPPWRVRVADSGGARPSGVADPDLAGADRAGVDGGTVAAVLVVDPGGDPADHPALASGARRAVPDPAARAYPVG